MKQNKLFNYLKTTIKSSDSKPPPGTAEKKNPPATPEKKFKEVTNSPASAFKSQKPSSQEEKDIQKAIEESLKITPTPPSNTKNFKRLKKGKDLETQNVPIKLPPNISETKKSREFQKQRNSGDF